MKNSAAQPKSVGIDLFAPEHVEIIGKLTNLMFAVVDEPALGADEGFTREHLLHACKLSVSILEHPTV